MDLSLKTIALDQGAAAILRNGPNPDPLLPKEILDALAGRAPADLPGLRLHFNRGADEYTCRAYLVERHGNELPPAIVALHLERDWSASDVLSAISLEYRLTEREEEALRGIAIGLTNKELAEQMHISPNTVKSFVRLIMIKMKVSTRAGIIVKLLGHGGG